MKKEGPCAVCGTPTGELLFRDRLLGIPVCSKKCEDEYLNRLSPNVRGQMDLVQYLDEKMARIKRRENMCWVAAGFGLLIGVAGVLAANSTVFIVGVFPMTGGALLTRYFEEARYKLLKIRKRIVI